MRNTAAGVGDSMAERAQQQVIIIQLKSIPVTFTFWFLIYKAMDKILSYCSKFVIIRGPF